MSDPGLNRVAPDETDSRLTRVRNARFVVDWFLIVLFAALAYTFYDRARDAQTVVDPPQERRLGIAGRSPQLGKLAALSTEGAQQIEDVTVTLTRGCTNPVDVVYEATWFVQSPSTSTLNEVLGDGLQVDIAVTDPNVEWSTRVESTLPGGDAEPRFRFKPPPGEGVVAQASWPARHAIKGIGSVPVVTIRAAFTANWVTHRAPHSCYVEGPALAITNNPAPALLPLLGPSENSPVINGATRITGRFFSRYTGTVDPHLSDPPPDDVRTRRWVCDWRAPGSPYERTSIQQLIRERSCSTIAVFNEPNAGGDVASTVFRGGVFVGLFVSLAATLFMPYARRGALWIVLGRKRIGSGGVDAR